LEQASIVAILLTTTGLLTMATNTSRHQGWSEAKASNSHTEATATATSAGDRYQEGNIGAANVGHFLDGCG
jgi:hypothetical protein